MPDWGSDMCRVDGGARDRKDTYAGVAEIHPTALRLRHVALCNAFNVAAGILLLCIPAWSKEVGAPEQ